MTISERRKIEGLPGLAFDTSYARLPDRFFTEVTARAAKAPKLVKLNEPLATKLGMDIKALDSERAARVFSGQELPGDGQLLAMAYSGHQFGHFNPTLGDGRAGLIGEVVDTDGVRTDIQLKGSGPTPFSRGGDGFAAVGPVMREYIISEAMHALGVPTTRSLAIVLTGEKVYREAMLPGAVLTRTAQSHLRIGTFQYFAARGDTEGVKALADYAIERHYPHLQNGENAYLRLIEAVVARQAELVARWMALGFIHGVMNTDNMTISGETIDYGPCAFMDHYEHHKVFSSIDQQGRYAYGAQPQIAQWNLARLAETLVLLIDDDADKAIEEATQAVRDFSQKFSAEWRKRMGAKFGFDESVDREAGSAIIRGFLTLLQKHKADFTNAFSALTKSADDDFKSGELTFLFNADPELETWMLDWRAMLETSDAKSTIERMRMANPVYIPRNHLVEEAIRAGEDSNDFQPMEDLLDVVTHPFEMHEGKERYAAPPEPDEEILQTFCGT